eukprot:SAG11_NODE_1969_length_3985_cov_2.930777_3_plen_77_part_00
MTTTKHRDLFTFLVLHLRDDINRVLLFEHARPSEAADHEPVLAALHRVHTFDHVVRCLGVRGRNVAGLRRSEDNNT